MIYKRQSIEYNTFIVCRYFFEKEKMKFTIVLDCDIETAEISDFILDCRQRFSGLIVEHFHGSEFYFTGTEDVLRDFILNYYNAFATEKDVQYYFDMYAKKYY